MNVFMRSSALAILALATAPAPGQVAATGGTRAAAPRTTSAVAAAPGGAGIDVRGLALDAFPEIKGLSRAGGATGRKLGFRGPVTLNRTRSGWIKGWPRIPDLPQVKAVIAFTNRIISRAEAARNPSGSKLPPAPANRRPASPPDPEAQRRIAALQDDPNPQTLRDVLTYDRRDLAPLAVPPMGTSDDPTGGRPRGAQHAPWTPASGGTVITYRTRVSAGAAGSAVSPMRPRGEMVRHSNGMVFPRGSMADDLNNPCATVGTGCGLGSDGGPVDPRLLSTFAHAPADVLDDQQVSPRERAAAFLRAGDLPSAAMDLIVHLDVARDDAHATRALAMALLLHGKPAPAADILLEAYRLQPSLAQHPISASDLPRGVNLRRLAEGAITTAQKAGTPQSWLVAGVLLQAGGGKDNAARLLARARAAGLDTAIADAFDAELAR